MELLVNVRNEESETLKSDGCTTMYVHSVTVVIVVVHTPIQPNQSIRTYTHSFYVSICERCASLTAYSTLEPIQ